MQKIKLSKKNIKILIVILAIVLSQIIIVQLVQARRINGFLANLVAKTYNLSAVKIDKDKDHLNVSLSHFFANRDIAIKFIKAREAKAIADKDGSFVAPSQEELENIVWEKVYKDAWLANIAKKGDIKVDDKDFAAYYSQVADEASLKKEAEEDYGVPFNQYKELVIKPFLLEAKVYDYLLKNFSDEVGARKAQAAYEALEAGQSFLSVAKQFSDDTIRAEKGVFFTEADLKDFYEPIKDLEIGNYSNIVIAPGAYIIWYLESKTTENDKPTAWEAKAIFIKAKTLQNFLEDFLSGAKIKRFY